MNDIKATSEGSRNALRWYLLGTLIAVELLMSFSFLGYVHLDPISITTAYLPVLAAGALLGPVESTVVGAVFGLASMWKASAAYVSNLDRYFSPIMSGHPLESLLLSVGSRVAFGAVVGVLYQVARRTRHPALWTGLISLLGESIHSLCVYTAMFLCFPELGYTPLHTFRNISSPNHVMTVLLCVVVVMLLWYFQRSKTFRQFSIRLQLARATQLMERYHRVSLWIALSVTLVSAFALTYYFVDRITRVLHQRGIQLDDTGHADLIHLQTQFMIGVLSLMALVIVFLIFNRQYATYIASEAKLDPLTGVLTRKFFFQRCAHILHDLFEGRERLCYFIMVDLDHFKEVNDRYGHPEGDRLLREVAALLRELFDSYGMVGRMGGDEFAVFLHAPISRAELEVQLRHFSQRVHKIAWEDRQSSCSIGVLPISSPGTPEEFYRDADRLLYLAKERGRDQFVIGPLDAEDESKAI